MPDTSCRRCGGELDTHLQCFQCHQSIQTICKHCSKVSEIQFHSKCMYENLSHTVVALA